MPKPPREEWVCTECGWNATKWVGRCPQCQGWGTLQEATPSLASTTRSIPPPRSAQPITEVDLTALTRTPTGVGEFDRVLGGGLVPGAVVLLAGEPGVGKSTLLLDIAARVTADSNPVLYLTGEESASQVRLRADRIGAVNPGVLLAAENDLARALGHVEASNPSLVIVDSVQTLASDAVDGAAGGVAQVRAVATALISLAKSRNTPVILVGHVTKDGSVAGPRVLEHLVDVVCHFEGDQHSRLRLVRAVKNRFGSTDEVGCFDLVDTGIVGLPDPSGLFLSHRRVPEPGTCVTVTLDGARPMPLELQALVASSSAPHPKRATSGVDSARVSMILAVLEARMLLATAGRDVYVATVGGARAHEPATDLALALALASAHTGRALDPGLIAVGEVGLNGQLRPTTGLPRRLAEAARLGFHTALVPASGKEPGSAITGMRTIAVPDLRAALEFALPPTED